MKRIFISACIASCLFTGCTEKSCDYVEPSGEVALLNVSVPVSSMTKTTGTDGESALNTLQVFVFRSDGTLEISVGGTSGNVKLECSTGQKDIIALVNAPSMDDVTDKKTFESKVSSLTDNQAGSFVMYGSRSENVSMESGTVEIQVARLVARISVHKITNALSSEQYRDAELELRGVYLLNVAGDAKYSGGHTPSVWYNRQKVEPHPELLTEDMDINSKIEPGRSYNTSHYFYCYPNPVDSDSVDSNWSPRYTRIVIEVSLDGKTYYYPISIPGIQKNHTYRIEELVITRPGSLDPDIPVTLEEAIFNISVSPWETGVSESVTI